ncbi:MAG: AsmA family protein [Gemmatimonadales bacterium]
MRLGKFVLIGVSVVALVAVVLVFAGLRALGSEQGRGRIAGMLSAKLGQPVSIGGIDLALIPTPAVTATKISVGDADPEAAPGVAIGTVRVVPRVASLLPGRTPVVDQIQVTGLRISLRKDSSGRWHLPGAAAAPAAAADPSGAGQPVEVASLEVRDGEIRVVDDSLRAAGGGPTVTTISGIEADLRASGGRLEAPRFTGRLGQTVVTGAAVMGPDGARLRLTSASLNNADLPALFALAAMPANRELAIQGRAPFDLATTIAPDFRTFVASGRIALERVSLGAISLENLESPFRYERGVFKLDSLAFGLYGGRQRGAVTIDLVREVPVYTIRTAVTGLDVNRVLSATTTMKDVLHGTAAVTGTVSGSGSTAEAIERSLRGNLSFELRDGVLKNYPILANVNRAVGITEGEGKDTRFERLSGTAAVGGGRARVRDLILQAGELSVLGQGVVTFDRTVDFRLRAVLSSEKSGQLAQRVGAVGALRDREGRIDVPVSITGSALAPRTRVEAGVIAKKRVKETLESGFLKLLDKARD